ncbi:type VI secretion system baseplate subunit TssF [Pseudoalteromonas mariniglutinosa]|uniref:type VI secretion system baseplate subunit TssF n=1 Tax=Pseudoalteromonas mariniglutinosa TaxID=206042 RepID=UPI00384FB1D2
MNDELLKYYNRELAYVRHLGKDFAEKYPKVAGRLKLSDDHIEDPHVSRLIESFAFLTANIRQKLDDSFPELTDALLGQLLPDYQAPIPALSIIKLESENLSTTGVVIPRHSEVETNVETMKQCKFQTCYETDLWPVEITAAQFDNSPFVAPKPKWRETAKSIFKIDLTGEYEGVSLAETGLNNLKVFINGQWHFTLKVYEMLFKHCIGIAIDNGDEGVKYLSKQQIKQVGFAQNEAVVPYSLRSSAGYRLLVEHFTFPEKFRFFDLQGLNAFLPKKSNKASLYFYLDVESIELEKQVDKNMFLLGCTPIINLFEQELEPVRPELSQYEYKLTPRYIDSEISEVVSIDEVIAFDHKGNKQLVSPFYAQTHPKYKGHDNLFWHIRRETALWAGGYAEAGTETYLTLVDAGFESSAMDYSQGNAVLTVRAQCSNRNLPASMPFGDDELGLSMPKRGDVIKKIRCLIAPTHAVRPVLADATRWQLVNHLTLDSFSGENASTKLKEILRLYDFKASPQSKGMIDNIYKVRVESATARVIQNGRVAFASGSDIEITFANDDFSGSGMFFFASILDCFFAQFAAINSFTRLSLKLKEQEQVYHQWPARIGNGPLL